MTYQELKKYLTKINYLAEWANTIEAILTCNKSLKTMKLELLHEAQNVEFVVTHPITGKQMEYRDLMKGPK